MKLPNYKEIFDAWLASLNPTELQKELAEKRLKICETCEFKKEIVKKNKWSAVCTKCGCPLSKKKFTIVPNSCPLKKWEDVDLKYLGDFRKKDNKTII